MVHIIVDNSFTQQLPAETVPCVVIDSGGRRIGYFTPDVDSSWYQGLEPTVGDDELDRREKSGGGRSLRQILDDLNEGS